MNDPDIDAFVARFLRDVADLARPNARSTAATLADAGSLLSDALAVGGDAWRPLYRLVAALVRAPQANPERAAYARLRAFVDENADLAERGLIRA